MSDTTNQDTAAPVPPAFTIRTLGDIMRLPTYDLMDKCLQEMRACMLEARALGDVQLEIALALAEEKEGPEGRARLQAAVTEAGGQLYAWPEETVWTDDDGGTSDIIMGNPKEGGFHVKLKHESEAQRLAREHDTQ